MSFATAASKLDCRNSIRKLKIKAKDPNDVDLLISFRGLRQARMHIALRSSCNITIIICADSDLTYQVRVVDVSLVIVSS